jgi:hypothetical protein
MYINHLPVLEKNKVIFQLQSKSELRLCKGSVKIVKTNSHQFFPSEK